MNTLFKLFSYKIVLIMEEFKNLELVSEAKPTKPKNKLKGRPNIKSVTVVDLETDIILERIADVEKEIKTRKARKSKHNPQASPEIIAKPEADPTQIIFIKGPIILDFDE